MIIIERTDDKSVINFKASEKNELLGDIVSKIENNDLTVKFLTGEAYILDGILRAALKCAELEGAEKAFFKCGYENELKELGYKNGMDIKSFFINKNCKNSL